MDIRPKKSKLGVASFGIVVGGAFIVSILITLGVYLESQRPGSTFRSSLALTLFQCGLILSVVVVLVGLGLGIAGLCQKEHKKTWAIWGIVLSLLFPLVLLASVFAGYELTIDAR